jgi:outer membrane immunogenic protein
MRKIALAASVAVVTLSGAAQAGGFYIGISAGHEFANVEGVTTDDPPVVVTGSYDYDPAGGTLGVLAGIGMSHDNLVFGIEGDINWSDISDESDYSLAGFTYRHFTTVNWEATVRARMGVTHGNNVFYIAGGYAVADVEHEVELVGLGTVQSYSDTQAGWTLGAGIDHSFDESLSGRIEYRYTNYGDVTDDSGANIVDSNELTSHAIRGALIMKF